jgi:hypothetical protein
MIIVRRVFDFRIAGELRLGALGLLKRMEPAMGDAKTWCRSRMSILKSDPHGLFGYLG